MHDIAKFLHIDPHKLIYAFLACTLGSLGLFFVSGVNALIDQLIYICVGVIGSFVLLYAFHRIKAPIELMEKGTSQRKEIEDDKRALEEQLKPILEIEFNPEDPGYFCESLFLANLFLYPKCSVNTEVFSIGDYVVYH